MEQEDNMDNSITQSSITSLNKNVIMHDLQPFKTILTGLKDECDKAISSLGQSNMNYYQTILQKLINKLLHQDMEDEMKEGTDYGTNQQIQRNERGSLLDKVKKELL